MTVHPHPVVGRAGAAVASGSLCCGYAAVASDPPDQLLRPAHTAPGYTLDPTARQPGDLAQLGAVLAAPALPLAPAAVPSVA